MCISATFDSSFAVECVHLFLPLWFHIFVLPHMVLHTTCSPNSMPRFEENIFSWSLENGQQWSC